MYCNDSVIVIVVVLLLLFSYPVSKILLLTVIQLYGEGFCLGGSLRNIENQRESVSVCAELILVAIYVCKFVAESSLAGCYIEGTVALLYLNLSKECIGVVVKACDALGCRGGGKGAFCKFCL